MTSRKRFLIAPLDWGLGHATRCIPIARALQRRGQEVMVAASGAVAALVRRELPGATVVPIVNYDMRYGSTALGLYARFPFMVWRVAARAAVEHRQIARLVAAHRIDAVISDSRFGCHCAGAYSVYLTHQVRILMPRGVGWMEWLPARAHRRVMARYDQVWIPDLPGERSLTGQLTRAGSLPPAHRFVGPLSRFEAVEGAGRHEEPLDLLVMLSGPEPQRSLFETIVRAQLDSYPARAVVLLGKPGARHEAEQRGTVTYLAHVSGERMHGLMRAAKAIVCRAGYTSIMELVTLGRSAVLVPTPGQTEQQYLARRLARRNLFVACEQHAFALAPALAALKRGGTPRFEGVGGGELLSAAVDELLEHLGASRAAAS